ncbi:MULTISPECIES: FAD-binding oxidoreductase [Clostridium]|uniref:Oxidoreductase n=1 Tax=Clostridium cibarium TaxID=2762247 RepID=A0ABR8PVZ4_9CLOT|nr:MULTISPECIES: FAD-binding oxidoreductase [Clostridium]MBD7912350.1 oxidoreductase [Clostridium cibarium]
MIENKLLDLENTWKGFKDCIVYKIIKEDERVTSLYIKSLDGGKLPGFTAGQFIAVRMKNQDNTYTKPRQYTLSLNSNEEFYRISVKSEENGFLSKKLCNEIQIGDKIQITVPIGNFVLKNGDEPLVLIGGGIGVTPMLAMAYDAVKSGRKIYLIYSIPNSKNHSFKEEINDLSKNNKNLITTVFYTRPEENDVLLKDFDISGRISLEWMQETLPKNGEFYFCGPLEFMKAIYKNLVKIGIGKENINYEMFKSGEDITK